MAKIELPDFIKALPEAAIAFPDVKVRLMQGVAHQVVFFEMPRGASVPPHSHCAQWGILLSGGIEITISGVRRMCGPGDTYYIPPDAVHEVKVLEDSTAIDFFDDPARYKTR